MSEPESADHADPRRSDPRRAVFVGLIALVVILGAIAIFVLRDSAQKARDASGETTASTSAATPPATSSNPAQSSATSEAQPSTSGTAAPTETSPTDATQPVESAPAGVTVLITSQQYNPATAAIEVVGSVQGAATQTSQCTAVATQGSVQVSASVAGVFDGTGTSCGSIAIPISGQPGGTWSVAIVFEYDGGTASSAAVQVAVPA